MPKNADRGGLWKRHFHWSVLLRWEVLGWIVGSLLAAAALFLVFDRYVGANMCFMLTAALILAKVVHVAATASDPAWHRVIFTFLLFGVIGVGLVESIRGVNGWAMRHSERQSETQVKAPAVPANSEKPPTLLDLFKSDFPNTMKVTDQDLPGYQLQAHDGTKVDIRRQVYMDFPAKTKFIGFYVSRPVPSPLDFKAEETAAACFQILKNNSVQDSFDHFAKNVAVMAGQQGQMTAIQDLTFSGRVMIYHEEFLSIPQKASIMNAYRAKNMDVQFMGDEYLGAQVIAWHQKHDKD